MKLTELTLSVPVPRSLKIILAADLHGRDSKNAIRLLENAAPDMILCPGDMMEQTHRTSVRDSFNQNGLGFMEAASRIAPLYYSLGNHEMGMSEENRTLLRDAGIRLLDNEALSPWDGIHIGGLTSGYVNAVRRGDGYGPAEPDTDFLTRFASADGFKLLLCHHPEYYPAHIRDLPIHLTVSGHAHGGQWRIFGRGVIAPGQGLFPKYTSGIHEDRLCISRGMANTVIFPRFFNPTELVLLRLIPKEGEVRP